MSKVSQTIKNLISGISQQPMLLRLPEQLNKQVNGFSTESSGLQKRPPTLYVANLGAVPSNSNSLVHIVKRDNDEQYIMLFDGTDIKIWDVEGKSYTVKYEGSSKNYIKTINPRIGIRLATIADYTFVVNREVVVNEGTAKVPFTWDNSSCVIHVKSGQYGRTYRVYINGSLQASYTTPNGDNAADTQKIDTNFIRDQLANGMKNNGWAVETYNSCLWCHKNGLTITNVVCDDGFNGQGMFGIFHVAQKFTNLPVTCKNGYTVKVLGDNGSAADDYYVTYDSSANIWKETARPGIIAGYNKATMPHILVRNADKTFTLKEGPWEDRDTGDDDSNPFPSFVGDTINDVFLYRNRLGFLSGENVILSRSALYFNFWTASAVEVQDTDPIDVAVSNSNVCILEHAIPFNKDLVLFSDNTQFIMGTEGVLTPQNATAPLATQFAADVNVSPVGAGRRIYFIVKRALYSSVREYYTMNDTIGTKDAQEITSHVPSLIPNGVYAINPCSNENILLFLTTGEKSKIYVYKYLFTEEDRMQSSWSYWDFNDGVIFGGGFIDSVYYMVVQRGNALFLEKMVFTYNTKDYDDEPYRVFLDRKAISAAIPDGNYDDINDRTQLHLANAYDNQISKGTAYGIITPDGHYFEYDADDVIKDNVWIEGDLRGQKVVIGQVYTFLAELSEIMIKQRTDAGILAEEDGRLQLMRILFNFWNSGYFEIHVKHKDKRTDYVYYHTSRVLGSYVNKIGEIPLETGSITVPVFSVSTNCTISIESKAPTPLSLIGYMWTGNYIKRSRSL